ncbi:MAG: hypothetical protein K1X36_03540 [Pyrinomonadaceae bacterium]|nr:hypothetical protein [Pyrinomonadaceae bacterium]
MTKSKNHNSILVLATLGVYLGLVLVGATPQLLAQAAMTRQFDVKDEMEFKDDLDTKPDLSSDDIVRGPKSVPDGKVTASIHRFLDQFRTIGEHSAFLIPKSGIIDLVDPGSARSTDNASLPIAPNISFFRLVSVTNLPRAGLDPLIS